jgi:hypothetical protein
MKNEGDPQTTSSILHTCLTCGRKTCDSQPETNDPIDCKDWKPNGNENENENENKKANVNYGEVKKYDIAREYRKGMAYCISGGGLEQAQSEDWKAGWEYAYRNIRRQVNDAMQNYIVEKGYAPFEQVQTMRTANDKIKTL